MRIRSQLTAAAVVAAVLAVGLASIQSADAAARTEARAAHLTLSPAVQKHLLTLFAKDRGIPVADIADIAPGAVRGPRTGSGQDWMMISFEPSSRAGATVKVKFQDGGGAGVFTHTAGHAWTLAGLGGEPVGCAVRIPPLVRHAWHLPSCQAPAGSARPAIGGGPSASTTGDLANIALAQVGVSDNPASTNFGYDCNPYTTLVGNPDGAANCGTTTSNGSWFSNVENANEVWCADFTKWVWEKAGVTSGLGTLTPGAASFYTWGVDHGENISFGGTPQVGDAVLFYPPGTTAPNGNYADHVGIVTSVNSNGTVNLVNGDFGGSSNISVQYNTDVPGPSWYQSGEEWAFVSPLLPAGTTGGSLYALGPDKSYVSVYNGTGTGPGAWTKIGGPATVLYAGGDGLFAVNPNDHTINRYNGTPGSWTPIGGPGAEYAVTANHIYGLNTAKSAVSVYNGTGTGPGAWTKIGGPATALYGGGDGLFATNPNGTINRYNGTPFSWSVIGGPGASYAVSGDHIYGLNTAKSAVSVYNGTGSSPGDWTVIGGPARQIAATG